MSMMLRSISIKSKQISLSLRTFSAVSGRRMNPADVQLNRGSTVGTFTENDRIKFEKAADEAKNDLAYCLSFANDDSDFQRNFHRIVSDG